MSKTASNIVDRALTLVDEQITTFADAASTEMSLRDMALEILPEVARDLVKELPYELKRYLAETAVLVADTLGTGEDQSTYVKKKVVFAAPADFWELVSLRMTVWAKPVTSYILIDSPEYSIQNNPFSRSGKQNPSVAISNTKLLSNARIECFSVHNADVSTVEVFEYVKFSNVPDDIGTTWPDELFDEITKALASQLNLIKSRLQEGAIRGEEAGKAIEQHE
jgi:hypothetical protein